MRRFRVIQLDPEPAAPTRSEPVHVEGTPWIKHEKINTPSCDGYEKRWRDGDILFIERQTTQELSTRYGAEIRQEYTLRKVPACVDFSDIMAATEFVVDEFESSCPWDNCCGFDHVEIDINQRPEVLQGSRNPRGLYRADGGHRGLLIVTADHGVYEYHRRAGASKQVARELAAAEKRRTLDCLVEWYSEGWWWYGAKCKFDDYEDSLWGFLSEADEQYAKEEVAGTVAATMQCDGYTILNWPDITVPRIGKTGWTRAGYELHLRRKLKSQNWDYP